MTAASVTVAADRLTAFAARHRRAGAVLLVLVLLGLGVAALEALTAQVRFADVRSGLDALAAPRLAAALGLTAVSYLALTFYDVLALRLIGRPLPWRTAALASFTSYTLSHNLGLGLLTGGSARLRVYSAAGLDAPDVARVIGIAGATFWAGVAAVAGLGAAVHRGPLPLGDVAVAQGGVRAAGVVALAGVAAAAIACGRGGRSLRVGGWRLPLPDARRFGLQLLVAGVDVACAGAALFVLIPGAAPALLPAFVLAYALGIVAAVVTHVPGGVGVFEAVVLAVVPAGPVPGDRTAILTALIAYRAVYYLLPLALGVALLAWNEGRRGARAILAPTRAVASALAPPALGAACFLGGALLLVSGALPPVGERMRALADVLPLPFVEASHIAASLAGTGLLLLAPGLFRRLDGAFVVARALLLAGAAFSIAKGIDYEEAAVCLALAAALQWTRGAFYRRTALTTAALSPAWMLSVAGVVGLAAWTGSFAYRHLDYAGDLWWRFAWNGDAPRSLRATLAAAVALTAAAGWRLLSPAAPPAADDPAAAARVAAILPAARRTDAMLALLGDKRFLFSDANDAFLMYQVRGASWIVMGDPVGPAAAWPDLLWRIREWADREQGRLLLYQVSGAALDLAIGMGLDIVKYGEEAVVDLGPFTLETPALRSVRRSERSAARKGATFRIVPPDAVPALLPDLARVSDAWVREKGHREKGFSLGRFDPAYLVRFPCALVEVEGRVVAFANLWLTDDRHEASIDLMRHAPDAPSGTMDYLFAHLMLWARDAGYARFSLGIAPLSGIEGRRLAPAWARAATLVFRHGERFYGFRGLRAYKEKFAPAWEPRYVAGDGNLAMARAFRDLARLIGRPAEGGFAGPHGTDAIGRRADTATDAPGISG